jgi:hypothetical protein
MELRLKIEGDSKVVRDFIQYIRMDDRYAIYASAKYVFSPKKDQVEFVYSGSEGDESSANETDRERIS